MRIWRFLLVFAVVLAVAIAPGRHVVALQAAPAGHLVVAGTADATTADVASGSHAGLGHVRSGHVPTGEMPTGHETGPAGLAMIAGCCGVPILPAVIDYRAVAAPVTWSGPAVAAAHGIAAAPEPPPPRL